GNIWLSVKDFHVKSVNRQMLLERLDLKSMIKDWFYKKGSRIEQQLAEIWTELLSIAPISVHDNFFKVGGDSILSIQMRSRAREKGIHITVKQIFEYPTIARLAASVEQALFAPSKVSTLSKPCQEEALGEIPLAHIQH